MDDWERSYKAREITHSQWEEQRKLFVRLYVTEDRKLKEVRRIMAEDYGFYAK
jgi:Clr5 domain